MKVTVFSTNRADLGALQPVYEEMLKREQFKDAHFQHWEPDSLWVIPDIAVICGDRFETLQLAASLNRTHAAIAHLSGGDITEGSQDDCYRHAITKLSHIHFPTNIDAYHRIIQMGEQPDRVHHVGSPSIDSLNQTELLSREDALKKVGLKDDHFILVALHPNTFGRTEDELIKLRDYLEENYWNAPIVYTDPNPDEGCDLIDKAFLRWAPLSGKSTYVKNIPRKLFLSLMKHCFEMVGNSSAMLYEAPTLGTKCHFIGDRQQGRRQIYGDGKAAKRIVDVLVVIGNPALLLRKQFYHIKGKSFDPVDMGAVGLSRFGSNQCTGR